MTTHVSLSESYIECIESFEQLLLTLNQERCRVIHLEQVRLPQILEEYGRTKIWGDQTRASLTRGARGSLDDTLRYDNELKNLVSGILKRLSALLGQATTIAGRKYDPILGSDHDSISSVSAESDSDEDDGDEHQPRRMPKILLLTQQIFEQIRSLYDLSALLRRPKIGDKYIRSVNSKSNTATPSGLDTLPLNIGFRLLDESHVVEKVLQWRGLTKSGRSIEFGNETVALVGQGLASDCIEDSFWFCLQLAKANTRRREQLQYWIENPYDTEQDVTNEARLATQIHTKPGHRKQGIGSQTSTLKPLDFNALHEGPKSVVSKQSFSTAAVSDIYDKNTNVRPRTVYAPTVIGQSRSNSVPDPPKVANGNTNFPCPYCGMMLDCNQMKNRQSWKRHVFRDLRPYICTFKDCQNGGKLYLSRHEWMYHEFQIHRRHYVCKDCHEVYSCRNRMSTHLRKHYGDSISPSHLNIILELCNRQIDVLDGGNEACLLCGEELSLSALLGHLATHMEDVALFVLPNADVDEAGDSNASVQVAKLGSRDQGDDLKSQASSLGFSEAGDHGQTPSDFATLLNHEEAGYASKFSLWSTTDEQEVPSPQPTQNLQARGSSVGEKIRDDSDGVPYVELEDHKEQGFDDPSSTLLLANIPTSTTPHALVEIFCLYGRVLSARTLTHKNSGVVNFEKIESAISARTALNGKAIFPGAGPVQINFAKSDVTADSIDRTAEYEDFMNRLREYHNKRGTILDPEPKIGSANLDLMKVFNHIVANGGYDTVSGEKLGWRRMAAELGIFSSNEVLTAFSLKDKYYKNLAAFEISTVHGKEPPAKDTLEDVSAKGAGLLTRIRENTLSRHEHTIDATDPVAFGGDSAPVHEQTIPDTAANARVHEAYPQPGIHEASAQLEPYAVRIIAAAKPVTVASLPEITPDILSIINQFGTSEEDTIRISDCIQSAISYNSFVDEISSVPEPTRTRIHDATKLREIRKGIDSRSFTDAEIETIAINMLPEVLELASDFLGNTVVQKLFEHCSVHLRNKMLVEIAPHLAELSIHKNGTWAVQKIIYVCETHSQKSVIGENLRPYTVPLLLDQYGNYVLQACLRFGMPYNNFIFETMLDRLWEIAQGRFGARAMRACLESHYTTEDQKKMLAAAIALHGPQLATDPNSALLMTWYLDICTFPYRRALLSLQLIPYLAYLCTHKIASLTVLKLLNRGVEASAGATILKDLFFTSDHHVLEAILSDQTCGVRFIFKVLTTSIPDDTLRLQAVQSVKNALIQLKVMPDEGYKRIMDEVGL